MNFSGVCAAAGSAQNQTAVIIVATAANTGLCIASTPIRAVTRPGYRSRAPDPRHGADDAVEQQTQARYPGKCGEGNRRVHAALRRYDDVPETCLRSDKFANDCADHGGRRGDLQRAENVGIGIGYADFGKYLPLGSVKTLPRSSKSCSICVSPTAVLITTGKKPIRAPISMFGRMPYPSQIRKSGAIATLGRVLTKTRNGVSARDVACDQAIAAPSRTPARPAISEGSNDLNGRDRDMFRPWYRAGSHRLDHGERARQQIFANAQACYGKLPHRYEAHKHHRRRQQALQRDRVWHHGQHTTENSPTDQGAMRLLTLNLLH